VNRVSGSEKKPCSTSTGGFVVVGLMIRPPSLPPRLRLGGPPRLRQGTSQLLLVLFTHEVNERASKSERGSRVRPREDMVVVCVHPRYRL